MHNNNDNDNNNTTLDNTTPFTINFVITKKGKGMHNAAKLRTIFIDKFEEIEIILFKLSEAKFKIPKFLKSKINLNFEFLTEKELNVAHIVDNISDNIGNFLSQLKEFISFDMIFKVKYSDVTKDPMERIISKVSRDLRGNGNIFNFVIMNGNDTEESFYIENWGIVCVYKMDIDETEYRSSRDKGDRDVHFPSTLLLGGLKKLLGFNNENKNHYELIEIDFWIKNLKKFYLNQSKFMISQLINGEKNSFIVSPEIYNTKLKVALESITDDIVDTVRVFDLIDSAFHDPKLMAASYFPDEHKIAIYLPVYLPLILPILVALLSILKEKRRERVKRILRLKSTRIKKT